MSETGWVPIALSRFIAPGTSAGTAVHGAEIVVWRDTGGKAHAWEDRCPHRGMKMSFGFVRGDHIACLYHGWEYDETGTCRYIPAHPDLEVPPSICVTRYAVTEAGGMIWTALPLGDMPEVEPNAPEMDGLRSLYIDAPLDAVLAGVKTVASQVSQTGALITATLGETPLTLGLQTVDADHSALHITLPSDTPTATRLSLLDQFATLRRNVESPLKEAAQ